MLELYYSFVGIVGGYLLRGIFISVIIVWIAKLFIKHINIVYTKLILKWIMIGYAGLCIFQLILLLSFVEIGDSFIESVTGEFWFSYWLMWSANTILPLILLFKRIGDKLIFLLLVAILMNSGWLFESFVIHVTSFHRDYPSDYKMNDWLLPRSSEVYNIINGFVLGIVVLIAGNLLYRDSIKA
jgi:hypothetical protein